MSADPSFLGGRARVSWENERDDSSQPARDRRSLWQPAAGCRRPHRNSDEQERLPETERVGGFRAGWRGCLCPGTGGGLSWATLTSPLSNHVSQISGSLHMVSVLLKQRDSGTQRTYYRGRGVMERVPVGDPISTAQKYRKPVSGSLIKYFCCPGTSVRSILYVLLSLKAVAVPDWRRSGLSIVFSFSATVPLCDVQDPFLI